MEPGGGYEPGSEVGGQDELSIGSAWEIDPSRYGIEIELAVQMRKQLVFAV